MEQLEDTYDIISVVATGTTGDVFKGRNRNSGVVVGIKRIRKIQGRPDLGFPQNVMNEIKSMRDICNDNVIRLLDVIPSNREEYVVDLVLDYCEYDLEAIILNMTLSNVQVRCYMRQIVLALSAMKQHNWLHRDMKPANVFITHANVVKIGDFGLAKAMKGRKGLTSEVITIWYRPPELLMGCCDYGYEVDVWSAGCILYEMITGHVLFRSSENREILEMKEIFMKCGRPDEELWKKWESYPQCEAFKGIKVGGVANLRAYLDNDSRLPANSEMAKDLLTQMLRLDGSKRISISDMLQHPFICQGSENFSSEKVPRLDLPESHQRTRGRK